MEWCLGVLWSGFFLCVKIGEEGVVTWKLANFERSPEISVEEDVKTLRAAPFLKGMQIVGYVQDTETGLLREVVGVE
jgi:carbonic anhydrase